MIAYVMVGTNNLQKAAKFYDELFAVAGLKRLMESDRFVGWGTNFAAPMFSITLPYDQKAATVGNGTMVALAAPSKDMVNKLYAKAIALGAKDEGAPGPRADQFYIGYFRDLDGNKLNFFTPNTP